MSTTLRKSKLIENCTSSISYDAQVKSACEAFDQQMYAIIDDTGQVVMIPNIMKLTDSKLVDILAWQFHVDFYDPTRDLEFRKRLVQMSIVWHKTKGTVALVEEVLNTYWPGGAWLQEWFEYPSWGEVYGTFTPANVNPSQNRIQAAGQPLVNGDQIWFVTGTAGAVLPVPLDETLFYYVINASANNIQMALTPGGAAVDITTSGTGTNTIGKRIPGTDLPPNYPHPGWHDRYRFRVMLNEDVIITPEDEVAVLKLIDRYKPVSRWPDGIVHPHPSKLNEIFIAGGTQFIITRRSAFPELQPTPPPT